MKEFAEQFDIPTLQFALTGDVKHYGSDVLFIFDEYYHAVFKDPLHIDHEGNFEGVFGFSKFGARRIMLGGVTGNQFKT